MECDRVGYGEKDWGWGVKMEGPKPELAPAASSEFSIPLGDKVINNFALPLVG